MKKTRKSLFLLLFLSLVLVLAACSGNKSNESEGSKNEGTQTENGNGAADGGELVFVTGSDAPTLDPHGVNDTASNDVTTQIYDRLVDYAPDGSIVPLLATEFTAIDELTWEFKLREGVKFHDGSDFDAEAVKMSIERVIDPEFASPKGFILNVIEEVIVVDPYTVQFKTSSPFAPLPSHLAHNAGSIIAPSAIEEENNGGKTVDENPIGTGPFKLKEWNRGAEIVLEKNNDYWGEPAKVDTIRVVVVPEQATRVAMIETGEAHVMLLGASDVSRVEAMPNVDIERVRGTRMDYLGFNMEKEPFDDVRVRQAISMAINKSDIVDGILDGQGVPAVGPLAPTVFGNDQDLVPLGYDVEKAKDLLADAGYPDGFSTTLFVNDGSADRANIAEIIQAHLSQIGIDVSIEIIEWGAFLEQTAAGEHELFILGWTTVTADADYGLYALFHSSQFGSAGNRSFYKNERVDELLDYGRSEADVTKREEAYKEVQAILVEEVPMVYLQHPDFVFAMNGIDGLFVNMSGTPFFKDVTFK